MLDLIALLQKSGGRLTVYNNYNLQAPVALTGKLTICIPDLHLLEKGPTDDFYDGQAAHVDRFTDFIDFLTSLKQEEDLEIIQIGDMYDLWQAKGNTNMITEAYVNILGSIDDLNPAYVVGNHDIDLCPEMHDTAFKRIWRYYSKVDDKLSVLYEHGFQADLFNNQGSLSGAIGKEITKIVGMMEYINPDIDVILGSAWDAISHAVSKYNVFTPVRDPQNFNAHEYLKFYLDLMEKYNRGQTLDQFSAADVNLSLAVIGHTHHARLVQMPRNERIYYLLDCGSWVNGGHELGVIAGRDLAVCQWS
jgi:UDP-2,3-diacylglucosamine pyrophosphatase LpxH